jgi:hypothetical protein
MSQEALERVRERNRLYKKKIRASKKNEIRNGVREMRENGYVELKPERGESLKHCNMSEEEKLAKRREKKRLQNKRYRASMSQEALERVRERNRRYKRKIRASRKNEEIRKQMETDKTYKSSMEEVKLEPDSERQPSRSIIRELGTSGTFNEAKPGLAMIKLEPIEEIDMKPDGITLPEPDFELDPMALSIKRDGSVVEEEDLPCPFNFLELEITNEDGAWDSETETSKVQADSVAHGEKYGVDLKELNAVGEMTGNGYVELISKRGGYRKQCNMSEEEKLAKQRKKERLYRRWYRASMSQEEIERVRERSRLHMSKIRAARKNEIRKQMETDRTYKSSMEEEKLEPDSERHPSHSIIREPGTSGTFNEAKPGLAVIKLEPIEEIDMAPDGIIHPEPDIELDPLALNIYRDGSVFEEEELLCPSHFLEMKIKAEDGTLAVRQMQRKF